MKNEIKSLVAGVVFSASVFALNPSSALAGEAATPSETAGFEETPLGDNVEVGPLDVGAVYFQPVDIQPASMGLSKAESNMHIEADIHALENKLGFGVGDFVPYLRVEYDITYADGANKGKSASNGTFMVMNASDGPHYGANINLKDAGKYKVTFKIHSPEEQGYVLHVDKETGVEGRFWKEPLEASWDFDYVPRKW